MRSGPTRWMRAFGVTVTLVLLTAACGDDSESDDGEDASPGTTAPPTTETPSSGEPDATDPEEEEQEVTPEEAVLADYEAAIDAMEAAYDVPDPEHPDLLAHWSGESLAHIQASLESLRLNGLATEATIEPHAQVELDPDDENAAWVTDCYTNRAQDVDAETREPVGEPEESIGETKERLELIDGTWMVTRNEYLEMDACTPGDE